MQFDLEISPNHPALPGHFPGAPVVPAVVLIEQLAKALEQATGQPVTRVKQLRLLGLIEPGSRVEVECREKTSDSWRLTCTAAGKLVAKGVFSSALPEPEAAEGPFDSCPEYQAANAAYERLPHSGTMELIKEFGLTEHGAQTLAAIAENHPLAEERGVPAWAALEYAAQLMACRKISMGGESMNRAVIVLVRSLERYAGESLPAGAQLLVEVTEEVAQPGAVQCAFTAAVGERRIAAGEFTVVSGS